MRDGLSLVAGSDWEGEGVVDVEPLFGAHGLAPEGGMLSICQLQNQHQNLSRDSPGSCWLTCMLLMARQRLVVGEASVARCMTKRSLAWLVSDVAFPLDQLL